MKTIKEIGIMNPQQIKKISKRMSLILRHRPELYQLQLDKQGWCQVTELLQAFHNNNFSITKEELHIIVEQNDKKRFAFSKDGKRIRANQGHSIPIELGYQAVQPPEVLYHGTATRFMKAIRKEGLVKKNRHHVHLSADRATAQQVGQRHGVPIILVIQALRMHEAGHTFYISENGVWLTDEIAPKYFS